MLYSLDATEIHKLQIMLQDPIEFIGISQLKQQLTIISRLTDNDQLPRTVLESLDSVKDLLSAVFLGPFLDLI
jgi:hypothetical protein